MQNRSDTRKWKRCCGRREQAKGAGSIDWSREFRYREKESEIKRARAREKEREREGEKERECE